MSDLSTNDRPATPDAASASPSRRRRRWPKVVGLVGLGVVAVVVTAMAFIRVPYIIISPGEATALDRHIVSITGPRTYDHRGELL
ncbi:MAG TPA: hypothetical protein VIH82_08725, partial [Acidimicrobiia bacterium]